MGRLISFLAVLCLLFCLTGCGRGKGFVNRAIDFVKGQILGSNETEANTFDSYLGFRDWYRFPLKHPYHFLMTDILTRGRLEKYNGGDIQDSIQSSEPVDGCSDIIQLYWNDDLMVFDRADRQYGIFFFSDGRCNVFPSQEARSAYLKEYGPFLKIEMQSPEYYYRRFAKKILN